MKQNLLIRSHCDYFITCDDKWIRTIQRNQEAFANIMQTIELIEKGSRALIKELGYSGFLRFIRHTESTGKEDYMSFEDQIFEQMSLEEIFDGAKNHWFSQHEK